MASNERTTYPWTFNEEQLFVAFFKTLHGAYSQASHHEILGLISQYIPDRTISACKSGRMRDLKYLINRMSWDEDRESEQLQNDIGDPTPEEITRATEDENVADPRDFEFWDAACLTDDVYVADALRLHEVTEALNRSREKKRN